MLTPLQLQVAELIAGLEEAGGFGLAGGAALIVRGDIDRRTRDLDFFGLTSSDVDRLLPAAEAALESAGFDVHRVREGTGFVRLVVERHGETVEVDLAADARMFSLEVQNGLPVLNATELAVDKVLAIFGRAEARDFVDLAAVFDRYGLDTLFRLAAEKDRGFSIDVFGEMLQRFDRLRQEEFGIDAPGYQRLATKVVGWREQSLELSRTLGPELRREHDLGL
jgi:hypothetical protein